MSKRIEVEEGSGNVFADIGLPNPEERLAKADLAIRIGEAIRARRLTQTRAAHIVPVCAGIPKRVLIPGRLLR